MKRLTAFAITALISWGVACQAGNPGETHSGDSALNLRTGENTKSEQNKQTYLSQIDGKLRQFDRDVVALRAQRDRLTPGTSAYKSIDLRIESMNSRLAKIRRDIASMEADDENHWRVEKRDIDENLADLSRLSKRLAE